MLSINCKVDYELPYGDLIPFQGNLKRRTDQDLLSLSQSLKEDGLMMPFVVWHKPVPENYEFPVENWHKFQTHWLLDGHARHSAIQLLAQEDPELLKQKYPVIVIEAEDSEEAKNALLQISASYGKITSKGLSEFIANTTKVKVDHLGIKVKTQGVVTLPKVKAPVEVPPAPDGGGITAKNFTVLSIKVGNQDVDKFKGILKSCPFVEVL